MKLFAPVIEVSNGKYNIVVNPAVECLGVAYALGEFGFNKVRTNRNYVEIVQEKFKEYKDHEFVQYIRYVVDETETYFTDSQPIEMALDVMENKKPSKEFLYNCGATMQIFNDFKRLFIKFVKDINFNEFFNEMSGYYIDIINQYINDLKKYVPSEFLFDFLGLKSKNLNILLMLGVATANYGLKRGNKLYCCVRPYHQTRKQGMVDYFYNKSYSASLILHEFAHSFINPLSKKYRKEVMKIDKEKFKEALENNAYGEHYETVINETIIRTIECLYIKKYINKDYETFKQGYIDDGFIFIPELEVLYEDYLNNRDKYKTIKNFYPKIIDFFKNV